jgi:hypothetical protein
MQYNQPLDQPTNINAPYIDGNPAAGIQGSIVPAASIEFDQREIVEVITRANVRGYADFDGIACAVPANSDQSQLRKAIEGYIQSWVINSYVTFTVHGAGANFPDLFAAFTYLSKYRITNNGFVTLAIAGTVSGVAARWTYSQTLVINHPNLDRIAIVGAPMIGPPVQGSDFQYTNNFAQDAAAQLTMLRGRFASELYFTNGTGIVVNGSMNVDVAPQLVPVGAYGFQSLLISADGTPNTGFVVFNNSCMSIANVSIQNCYWGIICNNCYVWTALDFVSACGGYYYGFEFQGCMAYSATQTIACSIQNGSGFTLQAGTSIKTGYVYCKGNAQAGVSLSTGSSANLSGQFLNNHNYGIIAQQSQCNCANAVFSGNTPGPIYAWGGAGVYAGGATGVIGVSGSVPAPNSGQGNNFAWIVA